MIFVLTNQQKRERKRNREREREVHVHGFLRVHVLFACVFEDYLLKPMRFTACIFFKILKPTLFALRKSLNHQKKWKKTLKPMCLRCKYRRRDEGKRVEPSTKKAQR